MGNDPIIAHQLRVPLFVELSNFGSRKEGVPDLVQTLINVSTVETKVSLHLSYHAKWQNCDAWLRFTTHERANQPVQVSR